MAATVSLAVPYARSIFFFFPLCRESNALVKSTNNGVTRLFWHEFLKFEELEFVMLWIGFSENDFDS